MQRKLEAEKASQALYPAFKKTGISVGNDSKHPIIVFLEGEGNPLLRHCPGRSSFGKFNPAMEDHSIVQSKIYRRFVH